MQLTINLVLTVASEGNSTTSNCQNIVASGGRHVNEQEPLYISSTTANTRKIVEDVSNWLPQLCFSVKTTPDCKGISPLGYWQKVNQSPTQTKPYNTSHDPFQDPDEINKIKRLLP